MNFYKKMKRFFMIIQRGVFRLFLLFFLFYTSSTYWLDINSIKLTDNPVEENTELNIKWAQVIEKYLTNYKGELQSFQDLYSLKSDYIINEWVGEMTDMIFWLRKIQTNKVEKSVAEKVMNVYIDRIKDLNKNLKKYLQNTAETSREETKKYQDALYKKYLLKFSVNLDMVISILKKKTNWKRIFSKEETLYNQKIQSIEIENKKLKNINKVFFKNKREFLFSLKTILWKIKKELQVIHSIQ